ncbi:MAG: Sensor histidine kinase RcsC [Planctomycetes bacterium]|nr:Sensor histidine kinase RcsC [Planctomycetota bacterium]
MSATQTAGFRQWPYLALLFATIVPVLALGLYAYLVAAEAMEQDIDSNHRSLASSTGQLVSKDFEHWTNTLNSYARLPAFSRFIRDRDEEGSRARLQLLVNHFPELDRTFVADSQGTLWADYPMAPESLGKSFSDREWFKGVSRDWQPYVSGVYRRNASPQILLVAIAVPVPDPDTGEIVGILVAQVRLDALTHSLAKLTRRDGTQIVLIDHNGLVAAHPGLDLQERAHDEYAGMVAGWNDNDTFEGVDPVSGTSMTGAVTRCRVGTREWTAIAQLPTAEARAPISSLRWQLLIGDLLLLCVAAGFCVVIIRDFRRIRQLNRSLDATNEQLAREVEIRKDTEVALQKANVQLAERVEEGSRVLVDTEAQLRQAQKMEAVGRLAGGIAHDFNNLLSVIIGYAQFAQEGLPGDSPLRADIEEIRQAGERASALTRQLLAFSRKQVLQPVVLDLNETVDGMDKMLRRLLGEDIRFQTLLAADLGKVRADPGQLEQVIVNLAINARDAMPDGGKLTVETGNAELDENYVADHPDANVGPYVYFAISDTGTGMDAATREKIFEPFFTTKERGRGTGLGLSTVYGIIKQSGGNIWVYSEPGRGTTFKVYLPRVEDASAPRAAQAPKQADRGTETVLILEDEPGVRRLAVQVLESAGYTVLAAENAERALELFKANLGKVQLLLSDVVLPGTGGPALAKQLQELKPGLKVLFMSGYTDNAIVHHGVLDAGVNFIEKPLRPDALLKKVRGVLDA